MIDAIVPAHNESLTLERVIVALRGSKYVERIIVVDDGSHDHTADIAKLYSCLVLRSPKNYGKGRAMLAGFEQSDAEHVGFFDADLLTIRADHIDKLVRAFDEYELDMCCGLRDYGIWNPFQLLGPIITGERVCKRTLLEKICPSGWSGYSIETAMNDAARRSSARVACVMLDNLKIRNKTSKQGVVRGMVSHFKMAKEIKRAERALRESNGQNC